MTLWISLFYNSNLCFEFMLDNWVKYDKGIVIEDRLNLQEEFS
jgi:hypothetical protein